MAETETIEPKEAREPIAAGELYVVDVRSVEMWEENSERLPGAVHIPGDELDSRLDELPDDKKILLVTPDGQGCEEVAEKIEGREVVILAGGVEAWRGDRLMTQPSPDPDPPKGEDEEPVETPGDEEDEEDAESDASADSDTSDDSEEPAQTNERESS